MTCTRGMPSQLIKIGDRVRLKRVPLWVEAMSDETNEIHTKEVFQQCVGSVFRVRDIGTNSPHEDTGDVELWVRHGNDCDDVVAADTIWVEPEYLDIVTDEES